MKNPRPPTAFPVQPSSDRGADAPPRRNPEAIRDLDAVEVVLAEIDAFDEEAAAAAAGAEIAPRRRGIGWGKIFLAASSTLIGLAFALWTERLVRTLFERNEWMGWASLAVAVIAVLALLALFAREMLALARLASVARIQAHASEAIGAGDGRKARAVIDELLRHVGDMPSARRGREVLASLEGDVVDGPDLLAIAERELYGELDRRARRLVLESARRVSVVTAVSPRALVDVAFVLYEAGRLIRRLSQLYGGRPGTLGFIRLVRRVLGHLAVTGSIAVGDSLIHEVVGHGLAARLSARLGEGVVNGLMTVRVGIAAMETVRPLPFTVLKRPSMSDFLPGLTRGVMDARNG